MSWWQNLSPRERLILGAGGLLGAALAVYLLVAEPLWTALQERRTQVAAERALLDWMARSALEASRLRSSEAKAEASRQPPYLLLDAAIRRTGLPAPARLEPKGRDGASAQFERVPFDRFVRMLADIDARGELSIVDVSVTRREVGVVNASLGLERTGGAR